MKHIMSIVLIILMAAVGSLEVVAQSNNKRPSSDPAHTLGDDSPVDPGTSGELDYINDAYLGLKRSCSDDVLGNLMCNLTKAVSSNSRNEVETLCGGYNRRYPDDPVSVRVGLVSIRLGTVCKELLERMK